MNLTPRRILISFGIIVGLVVGFFCFKGPTPGGPPYHGRTLNEWLARLDDGQAYGISSYALASPTASQLEAADAIHAIGSGALPLLMRDIHAAPAENAFRFKAERVFRDTLRRSFGFDIGFADVTHEDITRWRAAQGLAALGPLAKPAVPELQRLLFTNFFHSSIKEAAYSLATVGPEGIAILTNAPKINEWSGMCAIWALGRHPAVGSNVVPFLISSISSTSEGTACGAIQVLGLLATDTQRVVPALIAALSSPNSSVRSDAAVSLGAFGPKAISAVPQLQALTNDPVAGRNATQSLRRIQSPD